MIWIYLRRFENGKEKGEQISSNLNNLIWDNVYTQAIAVRKEKTRYYLYTF
jgi:hypothetical protein